MNKPMPSAKTYALGLGYMPWGWTIQRVVAEIIHHNAKLTGGADASLIDLMCGTGDLIHELSRVCNTWNYTALDNNEEYLKYIRHNTIRKDVLTFETDKQFDVVVCTDGIHHIPFEQQGILVEKMARLTKPGGFCVIAESVFRPYDGESDRRLAAFEHGSAYLRAVISKGAPQNVVLATLDIAERDINLDGEFKLSVKQLKALLEPHFEFIRESNTWAVKKGRSAAKVGGEVVYVLRPKEKI